MGRPPLDPAIVAERRRIAAVPGTRSAHALKAGVSLPAWSSFCATYDVEEAGPPAAGARAKSTPELPPRAVAPPAPPPARAPAAPAPPPAAPKAVPSRTAAPPAPAPSPAPVAPAQRADRVTPLDRAVRILLQRPGVAMRAAELAPGLGVAAPALERMLAEEAARCGRVSEGQQLGTWTAACGACGRPY